MQLSMGALPEPIVQNIVTDMESIEEPKTSVDFLREDCEILRAGVERMVGKLAASARDVKYASIMRLSLIHI